MAYNNENSTPDVDLNQYVGIDLVCRELSNKLRNELSWLEKSFGRAKGIYTNKNNQPSIYLTDKEYYSVVPNDAYKSFAFWYVPGQQLPKDRWNGMQSVMNMETNVSLIVWADLKAIDPEKDFIFTQELIQDVLKVLRKDSRFTFDVVFDDNVNDIFGVLKGFFIRPEQRDLLAFPIQAFRIDGKINYEFKLC